ncbi:type II toxin-antitoxin system PemK/MazF family toxin [Candidatus Poriferisodalis sp.]|uniref:type II toxin-antitoxin system PemK/MazF family toxin n=1 Tax=Candidatus Poriferisodalis sp. TaxID=3101277 RepID=UPI003D11755C
MNQPVTGGVYYVADEALSLDDGQPRNVHDARRPFVVLSAADYNNNPEWRVVLGCPTSKSTRFRTSLCVKLAAGEGNVPEKCWVRIPALQAIPRSDLQDLTGHLPPDKLHEVRMRGLQLMGLIDEEPF